jgi:hypothetical protein
MDKFGRLKPLYWVLIEKDSLTKLLVKERNSEVEKQGNT